MAPRVRPCCVPGCVDYRNMRRFAIPNDDAIRKVWLERIDNKKLLGLPESDYHLLKNYRVCENHFDGMCKNPSGSLLSHSLPTLNLPNYHGTSSRENCFLQASQEVFKYVTPEKIREALASASASVDAAPNGSKVKTPVRTFERPGLISRKRIVYPICESTEDTFLQKHFDRLCKRIYGAM